MTSRKEWKSTEKLYFTEKTKKIQARGRIFRAVIPDIGVCSVLI